MKRGTDQFDKIPNPFNKANRDVINSKGCYCWQALR